MLIRITLLCALFCTSILYAENYSVNRVHSKVKPTPSIFNQKSFGVGILFACEGEFEDSDALGEFIE